MPAPLRFRHREDRLRVTHPSGGSIESMLVTVASLISWCCILLFIAVIVGHLMTSGSYRRMLSRMRAGRDEVLGWALRRPKNDLFHRVARSTIKRLAKWDPDDEREVFLAEDGRRPDTGRPAGATARSVAGKVNSPEQHARRPAPPPHSPGRDTGREAALFRGSPIDQQFPIEHHLSAPVVESYQGPYPALDDPEADASVLEPRSEDDVWRVRELPARARCFLGRWRTVSTEHYDEFLKMFNMSW